MVSGLVQMVTTDKTHRVAVVVGDRLSGNGVHVYLDEDRDVTVVLVGDWLFWPEGYVDTLEGVGYDYPGKALVLGVDVFTDVGISKYVHVCIKEPGRPLAVSYGLVDLPVAAPPPTSYYRDIPGSCQAFAETSFHGDS